MTLSGDPDALEKLRVSLEADGRFARLLPVDVPYHSPKMDPLEEDLLASLEPMRPREAEVPFVSIVTGTWHAGTDLGAAYWWQNVRRPVRFGAAIECLADEGISTYLEVGPHPVLSISVNECLRERESEGTVLPSLRRGENEREFMLRSLAALFAEGREPDWETLYPGTVAYVPLPAYPWQRERHWFESANGDGALTAGDPDEHPLLGRRLRTPEARWEMSFDDHRLAYLHDHVIQGTRPVPAAAFVEMGLAASRRLLGHAAPAVQNVEFKRAFFLGTEPQAVQIGADQSSRRFDVQSPPPDPDSPWTSLAGGSLAGGAAREESVDLPDIQARCPRSLERADLYEQLAERGYDYGPAFQGLEWAGQGDGEALAALSFEGTIDTGTYELHPSLLDASFQLVIFAAASALENAGPTDGFLPVSVREVQVHGQAQAGSFAHARVLETSSGAVEGDVDIVADDGTLLVEIRGLHAKHLESTGEEPIANWLYELRWEEHSPEDTESVEAPATGEWLLVGGDPMLAQELASALELQGASPTVVPAEPERLDEAIGRLTPSAPAGVAYLGALEAPAPESLSADQLVESQIRLCGDVRELATRLGADGSGPRSLVLVTAGAEQATDTDKSEGLAQSALWGLGRVIGHELPLERCRLIDLPAGFANADFSALAAELLTAAPEDEIALRDDRRYVRRLRRLSQAELVPTMRDSSPGDRFRAEIGTPGMLDSVRLASIGRAEPGPGQVEIKVAVASLNFRDVMLAMGLLPQLALAELPGTDRIGLDYAGTVSAVGEGVEGLAVGDEVIGVGYGTVASHVTTAAEFVLPKPASLDFEAAAAVPVAFVTAYISLVKLARLQPGERVLIHAATGGVGLAAIQVARDLGAEIFATAGTPEKRDHLRSLGVEEIFDSRTLAFADEIRERTNGEGVDVVLNSLSGEAIGKSLATLAPSGRFVEIGKRDIYEDASLRLLEFRKNLSYFAVDLDRLLAEQPEHVGSLFQEVLAKFEDGTFEPPPRNRFSSGELSDALRHMAQAKHIGKVVVTIGDEPVQIATRSAEGPHFRHDGAYLVTGGLGGFGLAVAGWLAARGAGNLILVGRSEPGPETKEAIEAIRALGARVEVMQADVSRQEQVAELVGAIRANVGPLRGILHAAMVLDDGLLPQLDDGRFERVLAPKVAGAWNLHELTANEPLDFFVSFSSISSLFGNVGQGNYAAANGLLDAFAHYRRGRGLPALTVNWGALSGVGYLSRQEAVGQQLARQGFAGFSAAEALEVLGELIDTDRPQVMAARVAWERLAAMSSADAASPRLRHLVPAGDGPASADGSGSAELAGLLAAPPADAQRLTQEYLQSRIGLVLGSGSATIDADRPLTDLGLDSLMAVELLATLKSELAVEVAVVQLLQGVTLAELAALVVAELEPRRTAATPTAEGQQQAEPPSATEEPVDEPAAKVAVDGNGQRPTLEPAPEEPASEPAQPHTQIRERWTPGQRLARGIVGIGVRMAARVEVEGLEHVPSSGAFILAGNHLSMSDVPVGWPHMERSIIPLVSHDLRQTRWLRWVLSGIGHAVYIRRGEGDEDALTRGLAVLRSGGAILIAPEGKRSPGGLRRGNTGAAYLATRAGVPVVPVAAWGQEDFTSSWRRLRRAPVRLHFGPPLDFPVGSLTSQELQEHSERIMLEIARMLPAEYRGVYADAVAAEDVEPPAGGVTQERDAVGVTEPQ